MVRLATSVGGLSVGTTLVRLALIGLALAAITGTFAYLGGWFSPNELTPARFAEGFEQANGLHSGFRRNHAKGICVSVRSRKAMCLLLLFASGWIVLQPVPMRGALFATR
jgi:hypothetical protein